MKDEIISGGAVESSTTSASRPTFTPSPAAAQQLSSTADKPTAQLLSFESGNKQNSTEQTRPVFGSDNVKWSVSPSTGASIHRNVFSGNKGTTVQGVVINNLQNNNAPEQVQEQTQERKTFRSSSRSSRSRRGSSGSGRSRSGGSGSRSSGSSGIVYSSNLDSNLDNNLDNYSRPNSASSGGTSATSGIVYGNSSGASYSSPSYSSASYSYQPYTSPERYISKGYSQRAADSISNRFSSWYNPIVLFNQRIDDIIPNWWLTGDNGLVKVSGYFSDFDADMQQRILDTLEQKAEDEENNVI
jgi:hypothetical protein